MKTLRIFSRMLVGIVFMFSGFVKAVDPLGSTYKFQDYFTAFQMEWAHPFALYLGILLCVAEFVIGVGLLFGTRMRLFAYAVTIFMTFFTILTLVLAIYNPVSDCGCFGDAIKMTNWQTFYKNVVLMVFTLVIFAQRNRYGEPYNLMGRSLILGLGSAFILGISIYSYRHLPLLDFLPWKVGNKIADFVLPTPQESEIYLIYRNTETGETMEYTAANLPWQDTVLMSKLEFVDQRQVVTQEYQDAPIHDFEIFDEEHNAITEEIINNPGYQFLLIVYDINKANVNAFQRVNSIAEMAAAEGISFIALTGSIFEHADNFRHDVGALYQWYTVDETALKTIIRSNPGLVLLHDGVVVGKWAHRSLPAPDAMKSEYLKK